LARRSLPRLLLALALLALAGAAFAALASSHQTATASRGGSCLGRRATIVSSAATIVGTKKPDTIVVLGAGPHTVRGLAGDDRICGGPGEDTIAGGRGIDRVAGGAGNDQVTGDKGSDKLSGGSGDDLVNGLQGSDEIDGGAGNDTLIGDKGNDRVEGGLGDDTIEGGPGDDGMLEGGAGTDTVLGGAGTDNVDGGEGDGDVVRGDAGPDTLSGGPGAQDIVSYASATRPIEASLATNTGKGDGHDSLEGFEDIVGSAQADTLTGDGTGNRLDGGVGDDTLVSGGGAGEAFGGPGTDSCVGFAVEHSCGTEPAPPSGAAYAVLNQGLDGSSLVVQGGPGPDQLRIAYAGGTWGVSDGARIAAGEGCAAVQSVGGISCPEGAGVSLVVVSGGSGDDTIAVDPSVPANIAVRIDGNAGSDTLEGGAGDDVLEAGENYQNPDSGNDTLIGGGGADALYADPGADRLEGGLGNDLLVSSVAVCQGHVYEGGPGTDTVSYARSNAELHVALGGTGGPPGCATPDQVLADDESLEGSDGPDTLIGDNGPNGLLGHLGADTFIAKGGIDYVDAIDGRRDKRIDCGGGNDEVLTDPADPPAVSC
jgi:Ca2+-binding RTX toxin-like protein